MDQEVFNVVVNHEGQYSIWPTDLILPAGWNAAGMEGRKDACLSYIEQHWTDMTPASLRQGSAR